MEYDVIIVGAGPAGLSAALVLGRARRRVLVFDHGHPRNAAARVVNCFLGLEGFSPHELRDRGKRQAQGYGVTFLDLEVVDAWQESSDGQPRFVVETVEGNKFNAQKILLATGTHDDLPDIEGIRRFYGGSVHHCPYCDGWEHRDQRLMALADGEKTVELALSLRQWSPWVTACSNG